MNQKRKKVRLDEIKQKQNSGSVQPKRQRRHQKSSGDQSDFSQFELESKDINNDFAEFKKPKLWDKLVKNTIKTQKHSKRKEKHVKNAEDNQESGRKKRKQPKQQNPIQQLISFKKNNPTDNATDEKSGSGGKSRRNQKQNKDQSEQLIREYDKRQFNNKVRQGQIEAGFRTLERSRKQDRESQIKNKGMVETAGGVCFDVTLTDFAFKDDQKPRKQSGASRKASKTGAKRRKSTTMMVNDMMDKQQILRRRHIAFVYGELARRKTFGYY